MKFAACQKVIFKSEKAALTRMVELNTRPIKPLHRKLTGAYFCESCGGWHLTSMPQRKAFNIERQKKIREEDKNIDLEVIKKRIEYLEHVPRIRNHFNNKKK